VNAPAVRWTANGVVTLLTDFGQADAYVGIVKGVVLAVAPTARLVDLTHAVPAQDVAVGATLLRSAVDYFSAGTVHLAVVDPGVGTARAAIAVITERAALVGPDNGLLWPSAEALGVCEIRRLAEPRFFRPTVGSTFHGRDIFAPVAAHLAAGLPPGELGPPVESMQPLAVAAARRAADQVDGEVIHVDHFGNLITNIPDTMLRALPPAAVASVDGRVVGPLRVAYGDVAEGSLLALISSWGTLEIAVRGGSAAQVLGIGRGARVRVAAA
jgi:S-adenosylmethionine hydrolase